MQSMPDGILHWTVNWSLATLLLILLLREPYFIAYILAGVQLGMEVLEIVQMSTAIYQLDELGIILLIFIIGAEISLPYLKRNYKKPVLIAFSQLLFSIIFMFFIGRYFSWNWSDPIAHFCDQP